MIAAPLTAARPVEPGRHAWTHLLTSAIDGLPGPSWLADIVIGLAIALVMHLRHWTIGLLPWGSFDLESAYWGAQGAALVWTLAYVERLAAASFAAFRPALTLDEAGVERLRQDVTRIPWRPALALLIAATVLTVVTLVVDPSSSKVDGRPPVVFWLVLVAQAFNVSIFFVLIYALVRQARVVRRALAGDVVVNVFRPAPLHAISRLTARTGAVIVLIAASGTIIASLPEDPVALLLVATPFLIMPPIVVTLAFVLPLVGTHDRLVAEKDRLAAAADARLESLLEEMNAGIDARELGGLDPLQKAVGAVIAQRELIARLPTWPWSLGTARWFATAILLPLGLFMLQRAIVQLLG